LKRDIVLYNCETCFLFDLSVNIIHTVRFQIENSTASHAEDMIVLTYIDVEAIRRARKKKPFYNVVLFQKIQISVNSSFANARILFLNFL